MIAIEPDRLDPSTGLHGAGPRPSAMPVAAAWEWNALIAIALDGRPAPVPRIRRPTTIPPVVEADAGAERALVIVVAALAVLAALFSLLLI